ncbi:hypothetical protein HDU86_002152 [Geranomyces michiganensis]|nr:hypothetical protein HDU86_002152 [Geranomyces michiganensis]
MAFGAISRAARRRWALLIAAVSCCSLVLAATEHKFETEQLFTLFSYSLQPPYIEENLQNRWWDFGGDAYMEVNNYIRLTPDKRSKNGHLWTKHPFTSNSWLVEFEFKIHGPSAGLHGDGLAFWYTTEKDTTGPVFGSKDKFDGLGVFFDTYANGRHHFSFPRINAMLGDGATEYDHDNDGVKNELGACEIEFRNNDQPTRARVRYVRESKTLTVQTNFYGGQGDADWITCFVAENVKLPPSGYLGFSAITGEVTDMHDVIQVKTQGISFSYKDGQGPPKDDSDTKKGKAQEKIKVSSDKYGASASSNRPPPPKPVSGGGVGHFFMVLFKLVLALVAIAAICFCVWKYAQRQEERSFKRF